MKIIALLVGAVAVSAQTCVADSAEFGITVKVCGNPDAPPTGNIFQGECDGFVCLAEATCCEVEAGGVHACCTGDDVCHVCEGDECGAGVLGKCAPPAAPAISMICCLGRGRCNDGENQCATSCCSADKSFSAGSFTCIGLDDTCELVAPTPEPTLVPTPVPTNKEPDDGNPTKKPTKMRTKKPTKMPTPEPTAKPTKLPTAKPTKQPTTAKPTRSPTLEADRKDGNKKTSTWLILQWLGWF